MRLGLKAAMLQRGLSQRETARLSVIPESRLSSILRGWADPNANEQQKLVTVLRLSADILFDKSASIEISERSVKTEIPTDVRQIIVRHLGAALADAWRRQHHHERDHQERVDAAEGADLEPLIATSTEPVLR